MAPLIVPGPLVRLLENPDFDPPVAFDVGVEPADGDVSSLEEDKLVILELWHVFENVSVWDLHTCLDIHVAINL